MRGLIKEAGIFFASSTKRIVGSKWKLPSTNKEIEYLMRSLISYYHLNKNHIHSFILLKSGYPIFAFNPGKKYDYFNYLEKGRESDVSDFVMFIIDEHKNILPGR